VRNSFRAILCLALFPWNFLFPQTNSISTHEHWIRMEQSDTSGVCHLSLKPFMLGEFSNDTSSNIRVRKAKFIHKPYPLIVFPLANLVAGFDAAKGELLYRLDGGVWVHGNFLNGKLGLFTAVSGSLMNAPAYLDSFMYSSGVIPGKGRAFGGPDNFSSEYAEGYLSWSPDKIFNFQAGYGKHFWGDGYRSLFVSDVANPYPYFKMTANVWKFKYAVMYAMHTDMTASVGSKTDFRKKFGTFHYLSWNATKKLNFSFFETVLWQGKDSNRTRYFDVNYLNPVIFFRPVEYSLGSSDNSMIGFGFRHKTCKYFHYYGQVLFDEFLVKEIRADLSELISPDDTLDSGWWANKYGWQLGWKAFDVFKIKGLFLQQEFNRVRPYTYSHGSVQQNYGHMNQSLAHPLGSNFYELVNILSFHTGRWDLKGQINYAVKGMDTSGTNYGGNIFASYVTRESEYGNSTTQGLKTAIINIGGGVSCVLIKDYNLRAELGFRYRISDNSLQTDKDAWVYLALRTNLWNSYDDF